MSLIWSLGCAGARSGDRDVNVAHATRPVISSLDPDRGLAGPDYPLDLTIHGTGFHATDNTVRFGPVTVDAVSPTGTTIELAVPKEIPTGGEVPPMVLSPGDYSVTVTTPSGTSNAVTFVLQ